MGTKICTKCKKELPFTIEYFAPHKSTKSGLGARCRACQTKTNAERYKRNIKSIKAQQRKKYYEDARKKQIVPKNCGGCQRLKDGKCMVMIHCFEGCWAYTTDKDWLKKVRQAVKEYGGQA